MVALAEGLREGWWGSGMRALPSSLCIQAMALYLRKTTGKLSNSSRKILDFFFCMIYRTSSHLTENVFLHRFIDQYVSNIKIKNCCAVVQVIQNR